MVSYLGFVWPEDRPVTWAFGWDDVAPGHHFTSNFTEVMISLVEHAFDAWDSLIALDLDEVDGHESTPDIWIGLTPIEGGPIGLAYPSTRGDGIPSVVYGGPSMVIELMGPGTVPLYTRDGQLFYGSYPTTFYQVALHEIGHILGLGHDDDPTHLMNGIASSQNPLLTEADVAAIHSLYTASDEWLANPQLPGGPPLIPNPPMPLNTPNTGSVAFNASSFEAGDVLTVSTRLEDADGVFPDTQVAYFWYRSTAEGWELVQPLQDGQSKSSYLLSKADIGHQLKVEAAYVDMLRYAEHMWTEASPVIAAHDAGEPTPQPPASEPHQWSAKLSLFDITYYLDRNPDVARSGMNPLDHFLQFGGLEGRAPNADFDSAHYLAEYSDVAKAGVNPFLHYLAYGWLEGRDASAAMGSVDFATAHPEVADSASQSTAEDYLQSQVQHPKPGGIIPPPVHPSTSLVDAQFYYDTYQDVAQAGANAYNHYMIFGWHEGRDPDALFDTSYYLDQNADVAASGANPLEHYLQFGGREGRDPSVLFDTDAYLQHNADVAAAGVNPLLHYLQHGASEGRDIFHV